MKVGLILCAAIVLLSGCVDSRPAECRRQQMNWPFQPPGYSLDGIHFYEISASSTNEYLWTGGTLNQGSSTKKVSERELLINLRAAASLQPVWHIVFRDNSSSSCVTAQKLRALIDDLPVCADGKCAEATTWDAWKAANIG